MTAHRQILTNVATAVANSEAVLNFCVANFGRGLDVHVGAYAASRSEVRYVRCAG